MTNEIVPISESKRVSYNPISHPWDNWN
jgi:hypothetical protein